MLRSYVETGKTDACCSTISHFPPSFTYVMLYRPAWFLAWPLGSTNGLGNIHCRRLSRH